MRLYHTLENSREYHAEEPQFLEIVPESAPVVEALIHAYPKYITIENLPLEEESEKVSGNFRCVYENVNIEKCNSPCAVLNIYFYFILFIYDFWSGRRRDRRGIVLFFYLHCEARIDVKIFGLILF